MRARGQSKWWFISRFVTHETAENYDFILLWDDDVILNEDFNIEEYLNACKLYNIHISQPAVTANGHYTHALGKVGNGIGRFTNFVELMMPVFSRDAYVYSL